MPSFPDWIGDAPRKTVTSWSFAAGPPILSRSIRHVDGRQKPPGIPEVTFEGPTGNIAKPFWDFKPRGESGKMVSDLLPNLADMVDEFCFVHSLTTQTSAHPQGENLFNTGFTMEGFPSFGAWVTYALGCETDELPAFVAINDPRGLARMEPELVPS